MTGTYHDARSFSAALCRGLIEAFAGRWPAPAPRTRFPRLYAAASLKLALDLE